MPNATLRAGRWTTATCSSTDSAIAPHSQPFDEQVVERAGGLRARVEAVEQLREHQHREAGGAGGGEIVAALDQSARQVEVDA